jgi:hypothetical protein
MFSDIHLGSISPATPVYALAGWNLIFIGRCGKIWLARQMAFRQRCGEMVADAWMGKAVLCGRLV